MKTNLFLYFLFLSLPFESALAQIKTADQNINENSNLYVIKVCDKYGFINKAGKMIINPQFDNAHDFNDDLAVVKLGNKWGFIDKKGKIVINTLFDYAEDFSEG